jgi:hypothetical protein
MPLDQPVVGTGGPAADQLHVRELERELAIAKYVRDILVDLGYPKSDGVFRERYNRISGHAKIGSQSPVDWAKRFNEPQNQLTA